MKISVLALAVASSLSVSAHVNAQQQNPSTSPESTDATEVVERITVTGSNLKGVDLEGAQPLIVISAQDIERLGVSNLSELMRTVNQTRGGTSTFTTAQSGATSTSTPPGQAAVSLRGMGPSSTLTLVNGRRIAASSFAAGTENFVDINAIPLSAIESVEILSTGASAIYGADAVAGVINYILKKDYKGFEARALYSDSEVSANESTKGVQVFYGSPVGNGHLSVFADFYDRNAVKASSRALTANPILSSSYSYLPKDTPNIYFFSARSGNEIGNPNCATELVTTEFGEEICAYYGNEDDYLESPLKSLSAGLIYSHSFDDVEWNTDLIFSQTESTSFSSPAPINQVDDSEGPFVNEAIIDLLDDDFANIILDDVFIDPYDSLLGRELFGFQFDARFSTPRTVEIESKAFRLVSELSGFYGDWEWDVGMTLSRSESEQVATEGIYNRYRYHAALGGELCSDGSIATLGQSSDSPVCSTGNLLPIYNPFDATSQANLDTLSLAQARPTRDGESTLYGVDASIAGDLFEFNNNTVSAAFGVEIRREEISDFASEDAQARAENGYLVDVFGFGSSVSDASRNHYGAFAEFNIPLNDDLQMNLAGRFDDYNDFGSSFNPRVGFKYNPVESVVLRGGWSTAFRAPSLTQAGVKLRTTRADFDCSANQQIADLYCEGDGTLRGNNVLELGNPNLQPEESESFNLGIAYSPTRYTDITVDYWHFEHEDLVDTNMTGVLAAAMTDASLRHCGIVPEGEKGISYDSVLCDFTDNSGLNIEQDGANLNEILNAYVDGFDPRFAELPLFRDHVLLLENTGTQKLSGIDFLVSHEIKLDNNDSIELDLSGTHYTQFERNIPGSDDIEELAGTYQYPETVANVSAFYAADDWFAGVTVFYTGSYEDDIERLRGREIDELISLDVLADEESRRDVGSWTTVDLSAGYYFKHVDVRLRVENLLDEDAPIAYGSSRGYDSFNHNPFGRRFTLTLDYRY